MRQGKSPVIHSLVKEKKKKISEPVKMKTVKVGDNHNTTFIVPVGKSDKSVIKRYLESRKY